jgi:hypothetical protein
MATKLIFIEGIPGSGKTTTAQFVRDCVQKSGNSPKLYLENAPYHPVDLDNLSYFETQQFDQFCHQFGTHKSRIDDITERGKNGYFVHYLRWFELFPENIPDNLLDALMKNDAHDTLPPQKYHNLQKERWERFSTEFKKRDEIVILECCLFQNPLTFYVGKHNYDLAAVQSIIYELAEIVSGLSPALIYLHTDCVRKTLQRVIETRPQKWLDLVISYVTGQGYGKAKGLQGLEGTFSFYDMMQKQMEELILNLRWEKMYVNNSGWEWEKYNKNIIRFLKNHM